MNLVEKDAVINALQFAEEGIWGWKGEITKTVNTLPSINLIHCMDCIWWTKQENSLQGRCERYGIYPTGHWYCASAKEGKNT